jgi:hypothetical protein
MTKWYQAVSAILIFEFALSLGKGIVLDQTANFRYNNHLHGGDIAKDFRIVLVPTMRDAKDFRLLLFFFLRERVCFINQP